jgi:hypothetical protein
MTMNTKEIAKLLHGIEYKRPHQIPIQIQEIAKANGIVIVIGANDDLVQLCGALNDELCASEFKISPYGVVPDFNDLLSRSDRDGLRSFFAFEYTSMPIKPIYGQNHKAWQYETPIVHDQFDIMEDGNIYCTGIVFRLADVCHGTSGDNLLRAVSSAMAQASNPSMSPDELVPDTHRQGNMVRRWQTFSHMAKAAIEQIFLHLKDHKA